MNEPTPAPALGSKIAISAIFSMLQTFGGALAFIVCEILAQAYGLPATPGLALSISTIVTIPLTIICIVVAAKYGIVKIE